MNQNYEENLNNYNNTSTYYVVNALQDLVGPHIVSLPTSKACRRIEHVAADFSLQCVPRPQKFSRLTALFHSQCFYIVDKRNISD